MKHNIDVEEIVAEHDDRKRKEEEDAILQKAKSLTNGKAGDAKLTGELLLCIAEEQIEQGRLLRIVVQSLTKFQKKDLCVLQHAGRMGKIALFGQTYKMPMCLAMVLLFIMWYIEYGAK